MMTTLIETQVMISKVMSSNTQCMCITLACISRTIVGLWRFFILPMSFSRSQNEIIDDFFVTSLQEKKMNRIQDQIQYGFKKKLLSLTCNDH